MIPATAAHSAVMAAIHADAFPPAERWGSDALALQLGLPGGFGFLIEGTGGAAGFVLARTIADEAEILTLAVSADERRRGRGRSLLLAVMAEAARRGADWMFLEVAESNSAANALYILSGFHDVGRRVGYYPGGAAARVMRRALTPTDVAPARS